MNINCTICSDLFVQAAEIYTTRCGHIFHYHCLMQWIERSKTCPQCRNKTTDKLINRVYFNFANADFVKEDAVTLQNKVDSLTLNLRVKEKELKAAEDKLTQALNDQTTIENKLIQSHTELAQSKSAVAAYKDQLLFAKEKVKRAEKVEIELQGLKEKWLSYEDITKCITGSYEEATKIAKDCSNLETLSIIVASLKKEVTKLEKKKDKLFLDLKRTEKQLSITRKEAAFYKDETEKLRFIEQTHQHCEKETQALKKRIEDMTQDLVKNSKLNPVLQRVLQESPIPKLTRPKSKSVLEENSSFELIDSPDVATRVKQIQDSDSPYLQVKSNSMGMLLSSQLGGIRSTQKGTMSIFKTKRSESEPSKKAVPEDMCYNGLGGHAKPDIFPTAKPAQVQGVKRSKSTSTITASKFRKLAKPQTTKIDNFLNVSDIE